MKFQNGLLKTSHTRKKTEMTPLVLYGYKIIIKIVLRENDLNNLFIRRRHSWRVPSKKYFECVQSHRRFQVSENTELMIKKITTNTVFYSVFYTSNDAHASRVLSSYYPGFFLLLLHNIMNLNELSHNFIRIVHLIFII